MIKAKPENKENPTFSEGIGNIFWVNNKTIGYSWYIEISPIQCGFINSDGTGETLPEALKNMEFNTTPITDRKVFAYYEYEGYDRFGIYDLSGHWYNLLGEINGGSFRKIITAPNGQRLIFKDEENITVITLNTELTAIEQKFTLPEKTQQIHFFDNSISSDNRKLVYRIMGGNNKGIYVVDINNLG